MSKKQVVILGAGYGGVLTAKHLEKKLKNEIDITLIDKNPFHTMRTELHEVACCRVHEKAIRIDLKKIFAERRVKLALDEILDFDFNKQIIRSENQVYEYDYLVIGTGSQPSYFGIPGAEEYTHPLWDYDDAVHLREHILEMFRKAAKEKVREIRKELLTFIVVGGGFSGVEMMGELGEWKDELCRDFYIDKEEVSLYIVDALPKIVPTYPDKLIAKAVKKLEQLGVKAITATGITEVSENSVTLGDKGSINTRTVVWTAGIEGNQLLDNADLQQNGRKRIVTNDKLQTLEHENVYVVGDNIFFVAEGQERPVPQMVENAKFSAKLVANNIYNDIKGQEKSTYRPAFHGSMLCIGSRYGLAHLGIPGKFIALEGFLAMFLKHAINLMYFMTVAGFNKCWTYILDEFVHIKDRRSIMGDHLARNSSNLWLVPLRICLGIFWIQNGMLSDHIIEIVLGGAMVAGLFTSLWTIATIFIYLCTYRQGLTLMSLTLYVSSSLALLSGAGRTFGLDYYVIPKFKKFLKKMKFLKKFYLYID